MTWEGFGIFLAVLIGVPLSLIFGLAMLVAGIVVGVVTAVCSVPVGVAWALAALVRPQIVTSRRRSKQPEGTD